MEYFGIWKFPVSNSITIYTISRTPPYSLAVALRPVPCWWLTAEHNAHIAPLFTCYIYNVARTSTRVICIQHKTRKNICRGMHIILQCKYSGIDHSAISAASLRVLRTKRQSGLSGVPYLSATIVHNNPRPFLDHTHHYTAIATRVGSWWPRLITVFWTTWCSNILSKWNFDHHNQRHHTLYIICSQANSPKCRTGQSQFQGLDVSFSHGTKMCPNALEISPSDNSSSML